MKKLILLLMLVLGLVAFAPKAEAGQYVRVNSKYGSSYVHKSALYGSGYNNNYYGRSRNYYGGSRYRSYGRSYYGHNHYRYYEPVRYSRSYYSDYDDCYRPARYCGPRYYSSRPRFAISFGF